jgi:hypothetical protein
VEICVFEPRESSSDGAGSLPLTELKG